MKTKVFGLAVLVVATLVISIPIFAHHGTSFAYELDKRITLKGTVTQFIWSNPHCGVLFDVVDDKGNVQHWGAEETNPHALSLQGWSKDIMKPGDKITIIGAPARGGETRLMDQQIVLPDGRVLKGVLSGITGNGKLEPRESPDTH
jgi:uncharacterized protein DUF6152